MVFPTLGVKAHPKPSFSQSINLPNCDFLKLIQRLC